ncbi:TRIO and F-actin-binding protein-like [Lepus europaeus]|uniref:TRIO and F-actin-binding protein-like n=1 Tax=Lepus europaeus TaxID=9983 RepID=UPI002B46C3D4|nr:TRIO and F-actin-binding protein-like [Lepus europaeus]
MEEVAGSVPCQHSEARVPTQSSCGNCLHPDGAPRARHQEPRNAESLYCDLPRGPPAPEDPPGTSAPSLQSVADQGLRPEPERSPAPSAGLPDGAPTAVPRSGSQELGALPYLEGPTSSPGGSCDQGPDADGSSPDDTSNSSSVDWDSEERQKGVPGWAQLPAMIPRRLQEAPSADSARRVARAPAGGDAAGQRKEDTCSGSRSVGQHWAKLRGENGGFSLERHRLAPNQAASTTPQSGPRSSAPQAPSAQRDTAQAASAQRSTPRATSPPRITHRDTPWTSPTQQDTPRASSTQWDTPWATSPSRVTQWDTPRASATRQSNPQLSCSPRDGQREHPSTSAAQEDNPQAAFSTCASWRDNPRTSCAQRDNPRTSCAQRDNPRTSCAQRDNPRTSSPNRATQRDNPRTSSPNRATQRDNPKTSCAQRDNPRTSSPNRATQRDNPRTSSPNRATQRDNPWTSCAQRDNPRTSSPNRATQRDNPRTSSPNRATQRDNPRTSCAQRDNPRTSSSPNRTTQRDNPRTSCAQRDNPRTSCAQQDNPRTSCAQRNNPRASSPNQMTQRDNPRASCAQRDSPKASCSRWDNLRTACTQRNNPHTSSFRRDNPGAPTAQSCAPKDRPGPPSPHHAAQRGNPRQSSPHRTNKDIPWASFPLRPTQSDGPRTSSPSRTKQSEVPWASIALRPTQGDRSHSSSPTRPGRDPPTSSSGPTQPNSPARLTPSSHSPSQHSAPRSSPLYPRGAPQMPSEPSQAPCAVCIGHRDAPRASSPPRSLQHDPFPFFPDPRASESDLPHHEPPYMPPAVCIGHRDAPRASSPPRHTQFDPFPFLPDTSDSETQSPQHDPPQLPPPVCIGYRDAPRASSPPRQAPEPSLLFQDLPRASTESLVPSTDSLHEPLRLPTPVCIGHRDAPSFSSPPRQAPEPSLFFQDPPGTSTESLAPSTDSLHGSSLLLPHVCIGHRDAPRASSPPRHPPSDLVLLAPSPPPGSSGGSRGSVPPGETRHNLEREEYTVLADLPPPRRLAQREPGPQAQGSNGGRTHSPGRAEVERLFRQERRKSEAPGAFQTRDEGRSQRPGQGQSQLLRRQSSPTPSRQAAKLPAKQADPARRSRTQPSRPRSPERRPEGDRRLQGTSPPPRTAARPSEREPRSGGGRAGSREPPTGWQGQGEVPGAQGPRGRPERSWSTQEEGLGPEARQELGEFSPGAGRAPEGMWGGPPGASWGQTEAWEEAPEEPAQRGWGSLQELSGPGQPRSPPEMPWVGPAGSSPPLASAPGWGAEGACPHPHHPELDWRDLLGLLRAPGDGAWARLPQLDWEGLLQLLQARLPHKDPEGHSGDPAKAPGPELGPPGPKDAPEQEPPGQPEGWAEATVVNGHSPGQRPQSPTQPPGPACTSTQWPKTKVTSGPESSVAADLEHLGPLRGRSDPDRPSSPAPEFQPEEPEESEPSRGRGSLTDQEQADSADERPAEGKAGSALKGRLVTTWRMPGDRPTLFNPFLLSLGVLRWQRLEKWPRPLGGYRLAGGVRDRPTLLTTQWA